MTGDDGVQLQLKRESFVLRETFTISRGSRTEAQVLTVCLQSGAYRGLGECVPYSRYGESLDSVSAQILSVQGDLRSGMDRQALQQRLPAGAARNALDCALWDLEAKIKNKPVWQLAGLAPPGKVTTAFTLSLDTPDNMHKAAQAHASRPLLKIKLGGQQDMPRLQAVRAGAPDSELIVDANEAWTAAEYDAMAPLLYDLGVTLLEQPLPADADSALLNRDRPVPVCADESCHDRHSLEYCSGKYDVINVKLDKTGGLTEAMALVQAGIDAGFRIMVGCMVGSSLGMAPALIPAQQAAFVDLDGPLLLAEDRPSPLSYDGSRIQPATTGLWG